MSDAGFLLLIRLVVVALRIRTRLRTALRTLRTALCSACHIF